MSETNGHQALLEPVPDLAQLEDSADKSTKQRKSGATRGRPKRINIIIDAGNGRVKFAIGDYFDHFPSIVTIVKQPSQFLAGAFSIKNKHYIVGDDQDSIPDYEDRHLISQTKDGKTQFFPHMVIAALTYHPDVLSSAVRANKQNNVRKLLIDIDCLALTTATNLKKELDKVSEFTKDGITYQIEWGYLTQLAEGFGAAIVANQMIKKLDQTAKMFHILDMGRGTLTLTPYGVAEDKPICRLQKPGRGGGVSIVLEYFAYKANTGDGESYDLERLSKALDRSRVNPDGSYSTRASMSNEDLGERIKAALNDWITKHPSVIPIFRKVDDALTDGGYVFCTGGGFKIEPISHYITSHPTFKNYKERLIVLPSPQDINLTGLLKLQDKNLTDLIGDKDHA